MKAIEVPWLREASRRRRYLVGVSGGADSVALLHLLVAAGFRRVLACHLDHGLRGRAAAGDARFVRRLAADLGVECEVGRIDVRERMAGRSMETAAREARHEFFADCARKYRCQRVLLAHHADDQAETVLWNLMRGSHGLKGMRPEHRLRVGAKGQELILIRPLLGCRHADLVGWLRERGIAWREDLSNAEAVALRNRLRHEVLPKMAEIAGRDVVAALMRAAADAEESNAWLEQCLSRIEVEDPQGRLHVLVMRGMPVLLQRAAIRDYLSARGVVGIDRALLDEACALLGSDHAPRINLPGGGYLRRRAGRVWVELQGILQSPTQMHSKSLGGRSS